MIRLAIAIVCTILYAMTIEAQTSYYKLTRTVISGSSNANVSGGQFISFVKDQCYDSDINGFSVENGSLKISHTDNGIVSYIGESYWGRCIYKFDSDKSNLNIIAPDGDIYVYKKCMPPNNVTTSSLIKKNSSNCLSSDQYISNSSPDISNEVQQDRPKKGGHYETRTEQCIDCLGRGYNEKTIWHGGDKTSTVQIRCSFCHGKGTITKREYVLDN